MSEAVPLKDRACVRFVLDVKTPNTLNGSMGTSRGARMGASSLRKKQRALGYEAALQALTRCGVPTARKWIPPKVRKGAVVRDGYHREVVLLPAARWSVELVRLSSGHLDQHDGLPASLKSVVDGVADALDLDDGDTSRVRWQFRQRKAKPKVHQVEVLISEAE